MEKKDGRIGGGTMTNDTLEAMAVAINVEIGDGDMSLDASRQFCLRLARAALRALRENISEEMVRASCATMSHYIRSLPKEQLAGAKLKRGGYILAPHIKHRLRLEAALKAAEKPA